MVRGHNFLYPSRCSVLSNVLTLSFKKCSNSGKTVRRLDILYTSFVDTGVLHQEVTCVDRETPDEKNRDGATLRFSSATARQFFLIPCQHDENRSKQPLLSEFFIFLRRI